MAPNQSVAAVIQENEYWIRLTTFLHDPLKYALLRVLHNTSVDVTYVGLPDDPYLLYQEFTKHKNLIASQLVKKRFLQQDQIDLLLPPNDNKTDSSKFDVTLVVVLIRNFTTLKPPLNGWNDKNQPAHDKSKGAGVVRGREWRNFVHHTEPKDIDEAKFNQKWTEGTQIIMELGYQYDASRLKIISLDPKHQVVLNSLYSLIKNLGTKQDSQAQLISNLTQQMKKISNEVQHLLLHRDNSSRTKSSSCCLKKVLEYISKEIKEEEAKELVTRLHVTAEGDLVDKLKQEPWEIIKKELKMLGRADMVEYIQKNTLITRGLENASDELHNHYKIELINCLVEQPLSSIEMESIYAPREDIFIDLIVLPSSTVDEEWSNSDRDALMKQKYLDKSTSTENSVDKIIKPQDEIIFIRGVAGVGKSTLIDMFTLKWAKNELSNHAMFDFVFKFTCRELNQILNECGTLEQLFQLQYPSIFSYVTLDDLAEISDRALIIVDGLDELKDIYKMDGMNSSSEIQSPFLQVVCDLLNPKSMKPLKRNKTIVCGRPKACEFVKNQLSESKIKTIEVCGFSNTNVQKYIRNFFKKDQIKATKVQDIIASSYNLKVMSTVPVLLWVICNVYSEDLIKTPINTNTELYFYACLVFLRNHFQGSDKHKNLLDIPQDQVMVDVVYSLMVLSVKTYMQNQVLFTDEDIKKLKCSIHLEQTGFIVKYNLSNITKSTYQFRHLILQEFLCGMYLCVTKGISPFLSNRELSSCMPTIFGIHRITQEKENDIFLQFYNALLDSHERLSNFSTKLFGPFRSRSYNKFITKYTQLFTLPQSMINGKTLKITESSDCRELLDLFKETNTTENVQFLKDAEIDLMFYKDFKNILNLLEKLHITKIRDFDIHSNNIFDENGYMDEDCSRIYELTIASSTTTVIWVFRSPGINCMECTGGKMWLYLYPPLPLHLPDIIKMKSNRFIIYIEELDALDLHTVTHLAPWLQEIAQYAIQEYKYVLFATRSTAGRHTIESLLKNSGIFIPSMYIQFPVNYHL